MENENNRQSEANTSVSAYAWFTQWRPLRAVLVPATRFYRREIKPLFDLRHDLDEQGALAEVERIIEFRGANVWALIFAILIASIGLNVNSTAVIIGAMLISPLMGPIVGSGVALAINDFDLLKRALRSLLVATAVSLATSTLYFLLSPMFEAQSELLSRVRPSIYDVLIALCGGAIGIISSTRRDKALNALSGVAIATALMPPLCTAGFGLANGEPRFFLGALYLFLINGLYICLSTFVVVRGLRFQRAKFVDAKVERRVSLYMGGFALLVAIPSGYTAYETIGDAMFQSKSKRFLADAFQYRDTKILEKRIVRRKDGNLIEVTLIGAPLEDNERERITARLSAFGLEGTALTISEAGLSTMRTFQEQLKQSLKSEVMERFYQTDQASLKSKEERIQLLENELLKYKKYEANVADLMAEVTAIAPTVQALRIGMMGGAHAPKQGDPTGLVAIVKWKVRPKKAQLDSLDAFLQARLKDAGIQIHHN